MILIAAETRKETDVQEATRQMSVALEQEIGDEERVDHVAGGELDLHGLIDRNDHDGRHDALRGGTRPLSVQPNLANERPTEGWPMNVQPKDGR